MRPYYLLFLFCRLIFCDWATEINDLLVSSPYDNSTIVTVTWKAPFCSISGYGTEAQTQVLALIKYLSATQFRTILSNTKTEIYWHVILQHHGDAVHISCDFLTVSPEQQKIKQNSISIDIYHSVPDQWEIDNYADILIGRTMFETNSVPHSWVKPLSLVDEIWVPSQFNYETFTNYFASKTIPGIKAPSIFVVEEGW